MFTIGLWSAHLQDVHGLATMSIDMSSEYLKVAVVKPGVPMEIVLNKESRRKTPAVVAFKDGETLLGDSAMVVAVKKPQKSFFYFLDLLAKDLKNPIVQKFQKDYPHYEMGEDNGRVYFKYDDDTHYYPEELLAVALNTSREMASGYAEQYITDAVITVPAYFNQAERKAVLYAADLVGLRVLQLMSDNAAVALNYGVFRRKEFNASVQHVMFFDMGAGSTVASIVAYQTVKAKEDGVAEINPQLTIKGVGFDRTLGGKELDLKMQAHLAKLFTDQKKTSNSVYDSPRAMAKLLKEAKRVKQVLSANTDHMAQIEGLLDDQDFRASVSRADLVKMSEDYFDRIEGVVQRALKSADMTMGELDSVILVGGGTRVPKVQETLLKVTKKSELGKNINADEAAALGAVYQAAHLSKGFKVKKFIVKDASIYPIQVEFDKVSTEEDGSEAKRTVKRTLFQRNNVVPQKKVMTFNKHKEDFKLNVNYADLGGFMTANDLKYFGSQNLSSISLTGVAQALEKHEEDDSKGIKAHFRVDESGIMHLDSVEAVFERLENVTVNETEEEEQSTFAKLGSTISRFFSGSSDDDKKEDTPVEDGATEEEAVTPEDNVEKEDKQNGDGESEAEKKGESDSDSSEEDKEEEKEDGKEEKEESGGDSKEEEADEGETSKEESDNEEDEEGEEKEEEGGDGEKEEKVDDKKAEEADEGDADEGKEEIGEKQEEGKEREKKEEQDEDGKKKTKKDKKDKKDEKEKKEKEKPKKPEIVTVKETIDVDIQEMDIVEPSKEVRRSSTNKLKELRKIQDAKRAKEHAVNNLESFIYETQEKLYQEDYEACSLEEERELIKANLSEASDWIYDVDADANATVFKQKLREMKKLTKDLFFRVKEKQERPELIKAMKSALNTSEVFLAMIKNVTEEEQLFTQVEIELLEKTYNKSKDWFKSKLKEQKKLSDHEKPVLLTSDIKDKIADLDRELRYLVGKAKTAKPKKKKQSKEKASNETEDAAKSNETKTEEDESIQTELPTDDSTPETPSVEEPLTDSGLTEDQGVEPDGEVAEEEEEPLQIGGGEFDEEMEEPLPVDIPPAEPEETEDKDVEDTTQGTEETQSTTEKETAHNSGDL